MHETEHGVALLDIVHHHPNCAHIGQVCQAHRFFAHLLPNAVDMLGSSGDLCRNASRRKFRLKQACYFCDVGFTVLALFIQLTGKVLVDFRL